MKLITLLGLIFLFAISGISFAQEIEWTESAKKEQDVFFDFFPVKEKEFYATSIGLIGAATTIQHYSDLKVDAEKDVKLKSGDNHLLEHSVKVVGDDLVIFGFDSDDEESKLYYQVFNKTCNPVGEPVLIASAKETKLLAKRNYFAVAQSENREFILVSYLILCKDGEKEQFGYKVFDKDMKVINEGVYQSDFENNEIELHHLLVSDKGECVFGFKLFSNTVSEKFLTYSGYMLNVVQGNEEFQYDLSIGDKVIDWVYLDLDNKKGALTIVGSCYNNSSYKESELYNLQVDMANKTANNPVFASFSNEFILEGLTEKELKAVQKEESKGDISEYKTGFILRKVDVLPDGAIVGILEQQHSKRVKVGSGTTATYQTYHHYYDILLFKFNKSEGFEWVQKIVKRQISYDNTGAYLSGFGGYISESEIKLFFNDNIKNYEVNGDFHASGEEIFAVMPSSAKCAVAQVNINVENGEMTRKTLTTARDADAYCIPKRFMNDEVNQTMILYFETRNNEKFGFIRY